MSSCQRNSLPVLSQYCGSAASRVGSSVWSVHQMTQCSTAFVYPAQLAYRLGAELAGKEFSRFQLMRKIEDFYAPILPTGRYQCFTPLMFQGGAVETAARSWRVHRSHARCSP
jgi:hypothetical protein